MALSVPIDTRDINITPIFKHISVEDINESERRGELAMKTLEVVEVRFAGDSKYSPVFPIDAMYKRDGTKTITYAERWADQYRAFKEGNSQVAAGTPLEMLRPYGVSDSQLSLCRVLKIYSIESLNSLEGPSLKNLGMQANDLKRMARDFIADRAKGKDSSEEIEDLKAQIEALKAAIPAKEASPEEVDKLLTDADDDKFDKLSDAELRSFIEERQGMAPHHRTGRATLLEIARELD